MNASDIAFLILALLGMVLPWIVVLWALRMQSRTQDELSRSIERSTSNQNMIVSEVLAHRTLTETGNQFIAGEMLRHSNAHDFRQGQTPETPNIKMPETPGLNLSPQFQLGGEDFEEMIPPEPGERE